MHEVEKKGTKADKIMAAARAAFVDGRTDKYVEQVRLKLIALSNAKKIVRNIERELDDLEIAIHEDLG